MVSGPGMLLHFTTDVFSDPDKATHRDEENRKKKNVSLYSADPQKMFLTGWIVEIIGVCMFLS